MAVASFPASSALGFRRSNPRVGILVISPSHTSHLKLLPFRLSNYRVGSGVGRLHVKNGMSKVFASGATPPPNPNADKGKVGSSKSSDASGPPPLTILAGILVFLIFFWILGSIIMWIVGLIVKVPPS